MNNKRLISIICVFLAVIIVPTSLSLAKGQSDFSVAENRALMTRPDFSFSDLLDGTFQEDYSEYLSDQFIFRDKIVSFRNLIFKSMGKKDINGVYIGKDDYLIEKYLPSDFDDNNVDMNVEYLSAFLNDASATDKYNSVSCVLVPSKSSVMTNKFPDNVVAYDTDYVSDYIEDSLDSRVNYLYLKDSLKKHNDDYIYYKTDHHWTSLGAFYGYSEYKRLLNQKAPNISDYKQEQVSGSFLGSDYDKLQMVSAKDTITKFTKQGAAQNITVDYNGDADNTKSIYAENNLKKKDKYSYFLDGNFRQINVKTNINDKKLLLIKDSFANSFIPFLLDDYGEIVIVDLRYADESIYNLLDSNSDITDILVMYNTEKFMLDNNQWLLEKEEF